MSKSLRLGIAGLGTVGGGVLDILQKHRAMVATRAGIKIEVVAVTARDRSRKRGHDLSAVASERCSGMPTRPAIRYNGRPFTSS